MAPTFITGALKIMLEFSQGTNIPSSLLFLRPHPLLPWQLWRQGTVPGLRRGPAWEASLWAESLSPVFPFLCPSLPLGFIGFQDCAQGLGVFPLLGDTSPAVTERGEEGTRQCGGHSAGSVGGCGSTQKGHYHMRAHTQLKCGPRRLSGGHGLSWVPRLARVTHGALGVVQELPSMHWRRRGWGGEHAGLGPPKSLIQALCWRLC